jgi:ATP-dependent Clp protease adaptor protein ClpS
MFPSSNSCSIIVYIGGMTKTSGNSGTETLVKEKSKVQLPKLYRVILLNDDYTSMDFVVSVLETIFKKSPAEAVQIMLRVHNEGKGVCGVFPRQIAETKISQVEKQARGNGFPLRCQMEEE